MNEKNIQTLKYPQHIAFIMDGNGRWAQSKHMPRSYGHKKGVEIVEWISQKIIDLGIPYLSLYAFSDENWSRPKDEIETLMDLLRKFLKQYEKKKDKMTYAFKVIGEKMKLPEDIQKSIHTLEETTSHLTQGTIIIALSYGSQKEILRAIERWQKAQEPLTCEEFQKHLDTGNIPPVDLLIRTSGEQRLSNFLLWQAAYAELYFTSVYWPDFHEDEFQKALIWYSSRQRRFGKTQEQI